MKSLVVFHEIFDIKHKRHSKLFYYLTKQVLAKMDIVCKSYTKVCYKKLEQIYKSSYHNAFFLIYKYFQIMPKGSKAKKSDGNLRDVESKCQDLLLENFARLSFVW